MVRSGSDTCRLSSEISPARSSSWATANTGRHFSYSRPTTAVPASEAIHLGGASSVKGPSMQRFAAVWHASPQKMVGVLFALLLAAMMAVGSGAAWTSININTDMGEGIIARFRTMAISRYSVLTGQALSSLLNTVISLTAVIGLALLSGFRPAADLGGWLLAAGLLVLLALAFTWLGIAFGMGAKTVAGANTSTQT